MDTGRRARDTNIGIAVLLIKKNPEKSADDMIGIVSDYFAVTFFKAREYYYAALNKMEYAKAPYEVPTSQEINLFCSSDAGLTDEEIEEKEIKKIDKVLEKDLKMCGLPRKKT